jgi:hypothetical protein
MPQQIRKFGVGQTAKVAAVLYALMGLVLVPVFLFMSMVAPKEAGAMGAGFALAMPILYGIIGFVATAIACALYNFVARLVGGIEIELDGSRSTGELV